MHGHLRRIVLVGLLGATAACSTTRSVRPVGEGKWAVGASVGGPVFTNLAAPIPTPLTSVYGRHGLDAKTDVDFALHVPVSGAIGLDGGAARLVLEQDGMRPAVMAGGRLLLFWNLLALTGATNPNGGGYAFDARLFEEIYGNASWTVGDASLAWVSLSLFGQAEKAILRPAIGVGFEWRAARIFGLTIEARQLAFLTDQRFAAIEFVGPANLGALSIQLGLNFYPGAGEG